MYMAPAVLRHHGLYRIIASELWCVGILFWEMLLGCHPFQEITSREVLMKAQQESFEFGSFSIPCQVILHGLLSFREDQRMTLGDILRFTKSSVGLPDRIRKEKKLVRFASIDSSGSMSGMHSVNLDSDSMTSSSSDPFNTIKINN